MQRIPLRRWQDQPHNGKTKPVLVCGFSSETHFDYSNDSFLTCNPSKAPKHPSYIRKRLYEKLERKIFLTEIKTKREGLIISHNYVLVSFCVCISSPHSFDAGSTNLSVNYVPWTLCLLSITENVHNEPMRCLSSVFTFTGLCRERG